MSHDDLREELAGIYGTVRTAFEQHDLDTLARHVDLPEGTPTPSREQTSAMAEFLPNLPDCRFLDFVLEGDRAAYYVESDLDNEFGSEVTVVRFFQGDEGWRLAQAPHTIV